MTDQHPSFSPLNHHQMRSDLSRLTRRSSLLALYLTFLGCIKTESAARNLENRTTEAGDD